MASPPTFDGSNPTHHTVDEFVDDLKFYFATKNPAINRRITIFDCSIKYPAKRAYDAKKALDNFNVRAAVNADNADDVARMAYFTLQFDARVQWLNNRFQGPEQQRILRNALYHSGQLPRETPQQFFDRLEADIGKSGFPLEQQDLILEQIFVQ